MGAHISTRDPFRTPGILAASILTVAMGGVMFRPAPFTPATKVLGVQATPAPIAAAAPETSPEIQVPPPAETPRVAPRPANARTSGPANPNPRPTRGGYVRIPAIGANAPILAVGLGKDGKMLTPKSAHEVTWLDNGTFPGPTNNAVIAGHRNWAGKQGSFGRLEELKGGDLVTVGMDGQTFTYRVSWVKIYDPRTAPVKQLLGPTPGDVLTLVTCGGTFNRKTGHYDKRVVARAELLSTS